jgi:peptide/nickel transport system permease protein
MFRKVGLKGPSALVAGLVLLGLAVVLSLLQPLLHLPGPDVQDYSAVLSPPSSAHPFGTDALGRDVLSRTLAATRVDLPVAIAVTLASGVLGVLAGAAAGYLRGRGDSIIMRLADLALSIPLLVIVLAVIAITGPGLRGVFIGVPIVGWASYARITRSEMLVVREKDFISAARTLGFRSSRILSRHALPNVWRSSFVFSMLDVVGNIMLLAALAYLGLGAQPPTPEWGAIIADGQPQLETAWWISTLPGLYVVVIGLGFSLVGDGLSEVVGTST